MYKKKKEKIIDLPKISDNLEEALSVTSSN